MIIHHKDISDVNHLQNARFCLRVLDYIQYINFNGNVQYPKSDSENGRIINHEYLLDRLQYNAQNCVLLINPKVSFFSPYEDDSDMVICPTRGNHNDIIEMKCCWLILGVSM